MKKTIKKILCSLLVVVMCLTSAPLQGFVGLGLTEWNWKASAAELSGICGNTANWIYNEYTKELIISGTGSTFDYSWWTNDSPFSYYEVTKVRIESGITRIGDYLFRGCYYLETISIPDSVSSIGDGAFKGCQNLTNISIPVGVTSIGASTFETCDMLEKITIPDSVTSIGKSAFEDCIKLSSITIPQKVISIGEQAFRNCSNLISINLPNSVITIGDSAFRDCIKLSSITIPESVTNLGYAFYGCTSLEKIIVDDNNRNYSSDQYGVLFNKDQTVLLQYPLGSRLTSYNIPESTGSIASCAFSYCQYLENITIPNGVIHITFELFEGCKNLKSVFISEGTQYIVESAFSGCESLIDIALPSSIRIIGESAFSGCSSLTSVTFDSMIQVIAIGAFSECSNIKDVYFNGTKEQWDSITIEEYNEDLFNATIHFLGEDEPDEPKPDGYKLKLWSDGAYSDSIAVGESIGFDVYLLENGKYLDCERPYAVSFDVPGIFEVSQIKRSTDSMYIKLIAMKPGTTNMTISDNVTGAYVTVKLKAENKIKALTLYEFDDSAKKQDDILTHLYNQNGIYINGFNVNENRDGSYHVVMNAYNEKAHYGAVVAYDKDGNITDYDLIKQKKKLPTNLWSGTFDVFDWVTYKFEVFGEKPYTHLGCTQWTPIDIKVPKDGHIVITNNTANEMAFLANMTDLAMDFAFAYVDFIFADIPEDTSDEVVKLTIGQLILKMGEKALSKFCSDFIKQLTVKMTFTNIGTVLYNFVEALEDEGIDFYDIVVEALGDTVNEELFYNIGEDIGLLLAGGPIQDILKACDYTNTLIKMYDMGGSIISSQTVVKAPPAEEKVRISNGVKVTSETPLDPDYVLHTYIINQNDDLMTNAKPTIEALASNYTMYDITLYKSGAAVQPNAKIKVMIPIPAGYNKNNIQVYWYKEDGTLESMNAVVNGSYAIFETDHLSYYIIAEVQGHSHSYNNVIRTEANCINNGSITFSCSCGDAYTEVIPSTGHTFSDGNSKCSNCDFDRADSCGCKCHKTGIISKIIWFITNFFNKLLKKNPFCSCGLNHY